MRRQSGLTLMIILLVTLIITFVSLKQMISLRSASRGLALGSVEMEESQLAPAQQAAEVAGRINEQQQNVLDALEGFR